VVAVIGPWNYPLTNSFGDCIPALAAGNAAVLKPASLTPLTSLLMRDALLQCGLPEDVFQVAVGGGAVGSELIDHVDYVMFTGSTEVGRKVMERAARTLTPVGLELGGKDPMVILADADLERASGSTSRSRSTKTSWAGWRRSSGRCARGCRASRGPWTSERSPPRRRWR
jgi:acyl-CoA reductase-like NAD-dependent aldehyde dehydrogenase